MNEYDYTKISSVFTTNHAREATLHLETGWVLLNVCTARDEYEYPVFTLGWPDRNTKPAEPSEYICMPL